MNNSSQSRLIAYLIAFLGGFFLVGFLDGFHSHAGVQFYLIDQFNVTDQNWPWFIPLQMGVAGLILLASWEWISKKLISKLGEEVQRGPGAKYLLPTCVFMIFFGYFFSWWVNDDPFHLSYYLALYIGSLVYLSIYGSRYQWIAFLLCGIAGTLFEINLLDPDIGYYRFHQQDFVGRAPGWLLFVYGWVGIFIHELSRYAKNGAWSR